MNPNGPLAKLKTLNEEFDQMAVAPAAPEVTPEAPVVPPVPESPPLAPEREAMAKRIEEATGLVLGKDYGFTEPGDLQVLDGNGGPLPEDASGADRYDQIITQLEDAGFLVEEGPGDVILMAPEENDEMPEEGDEDDEEDLAGEHESAY